MHRTAGGGESQRRPDEPFRGREEGSGYAKVYVFRDNKFDLKGLTEGAQQKSNTTLRVQPAGGVVFVTVHTGPSLKPFLEQPRGGNAV